MICGIWVPFSGDHHLKLVFSNQSYQTLSNFDIICICDYFLERNCFTIYFTKINDSVASPWYVKVAFFYKKIETCETLYFIANNLQCYWGLEKRKGRLSRRYWWNQKKGHFTHEPRVVIMKLWELRRKYPKAIPKHLQNHEVWSRTFERSVKGTWTGSAAPPFPPMRVHEV